MPLQKFMASSSAIWSHKAQTYRKVHGTVRARTKNLWRELQLRLSAARSHSPPSLTQISKQDAQFLSSIPHVLVFVHPPLGLRYLNAHKACKHQQTNMFCDVGLLIDSFRAKPIPACFTLSPELAIITAQPSGRCLDRGIHSLSLQAREKLLCALLFLGPILWFLAHVFEA